MALDKASFIAGLQVGLRIKAWEASASPKPPISDRFIVTEEGDYIITENGEIMITE